MAKKTRLIVAVVAVFALLWWGAGMLMGYTAQRALSAAEVVLPAAQKLHYADMQVDVLAHKVVLNKVTFGAESQPMAQIERVVVAGIPWFSFHQLTFSEIQLEHIQAQAAQPFEAEKITLTGLQIFTPQQAPTTWQGVIAFDKAEVQNITIATPAHKAETRIKSLIAEGLSVEGRLAKLSAVDLSATQEAVRSTLTQFEAENLNLPALVDATGRVQLGNILFYNNVDKITALNARLGQGDATLITLDKLNFTGAGDTITGLRIAGVGEVENLQIAPAALQPEWRQRLKTWGYDAPITAHLKGEMAYNPLTHVLDIKSLKVNLEQMIEGTLSLRLGKVDPALFSTMSPQEAAAMAQQVMPSLMLQQGQLLVQERGLVRKIMAAQAAEAQIPPAIYAQQWAQRLQVPQGLTGVGAQKIALLYQNISSFIAIPDALKIALAPAEPVMLVNMAGFMINPDRAAEQMNLSSSLKP